ncbi:nuclear transport factor 2 family protein [Clostridium estertheticum]|uniref:nuclear transport factor 2 family protein n=1 Tax=Clostridium estertheticum TaxID=238834 RepID=UPI001C0DD1D8|nr:nuclear transport factor 2 family protein [Clostridium estertheticum]MBU3201075.1 nuclear transport factor 2 family protein [Clostridium estertheticum]WAG66613.1 nuclear transport factor 2 family protein [Clostridium estertheticum]
MKDKMELKELVDIFSIYADQKDVEAQVTLFTEDAEVKSYVNSQLVSDLKGRKQIGDVFAQFLKNMILQEK